MNPTTPNTISANSIITYPAMYKQLHDEGLTEVNGIQWIKAGKKVIDIYNNLLNH